MSTFDTVLRGAPITLLLTVTSLAIGCVLAIPVAVGRQTGPVVARMLATSYVTIVRSIPPIVWLFFIYFGVGSHLKGLQPLVAAIATLSLISTAYLAEIYRGGVAAIEKGQWEASHALGMARASSLRFVIGPQIFRAALPSAATYAIGLFKDTSVAYTIGVADLMFYANRESQLTQNVLLPFIYAAAVYLVISVPCAWGSRKLDRRLQAHTASR